MTILQSLNNLSWKYPAACGGENCLCTKLILVCSAHQNVPHRIAQLQDGILAPKVWMGEVSI